MKNLKYFRNKRLLSNTTTVLALLVAFLMVGSTVTAVGVQENTNNIFAEVSPNIKSKLVPSPQSDAQWDVQFSFDLTAASGAAGNAGAEYKTGEFYSTRWAANLIHQYDDTGALVSEFSVPGVSGLRDLCYDGTYFYGGAAGGTIYEMDFDTNTLISSITGGFQARAIAYDSDLDVFYCSNFGDPVWKVDRAGTILDTWNFGTVTSNYGFAYDSTGPYLWVYDQGGGGGTPQLIHQWDLTTGAFTGVSHDTTLEFPDPSGIAGGLFLTDEFYSGFSTMGALQQGVPDMMIAYEFLPTGPPPTNDTGIQSIVAPTTGPAGVITPIAAVKNFGNATQTDVPVTMKIHKMLPPVELFTEDFESYMPATPVFPPVGWSIQNTSSSTWYKYSSGYARCSEDNTGAQDEWLISETFDCSALPVVGISMYFYMATPNDDYVEILGSTDNGVTWNNMIVNITGYMSSALRSYDITSWAAGQSQVKIAWRWVSGASLTGSDYMYFRQFKIGAPSYVASGVSEDFNGAWGTYGDNPPAGWTILDFGSESPPVWNNNDWYKYYYSTFGSDCARTYYSPYETRNEWLITPTIDCSAMTEVELMFRQYFYYYSGAAGYGAIEGSIDNGTTWTVMVVNQSATQSTNYYSFDISSWAAGQSQVKLAFHYTAPQPGRYWYIDDVMAGDITDETVLFENYWFDDVIPDNWGPNGWMQDDVVNVGDVDPNIWRGADATYSTTPAFDPYAGTYMAIYDTGLLYPQGSQARLYCPNPIDLTGETGPINLEFMLHMNNYGSSYTDSIAVQVSLDATNWTTETTINTYDAGNPGWVEQMIDLTAYAGQNIYLGFLGIDGGYRDIAIDDISLNVPGMATEYNETILINISREDAIFPDWTPTDWQVAENADIEYFVEAYTSLPGDENPGNDYKSKYITLSYPYLHDIAMVEIISPVDDGPAQTFNVSAKIANVGQNPEGNFTANVEIGKRVYTTQYTTVIFSGTGEWEQIDYASGGSYRPVGGSGDYYVGCDSDGSGTPFDTSMYTFAFDLSGLTTATLEFWGIFQDYAGSGYTEINVYSNGSFEENLWTITVDEVPRVPTQHIYTMNVGTYADPSDVVVEFYFTDMDGSYAGNAWGFYFDDLEIPEISYLEDFEGIFPPADFTVTVEYNENITIPPAFIDPGEELVIEFPNWTPADIALGVSGTIDYQISATSVFANDTNPANDALGDGFTLDYWHDINVEEVSIGTDKMADPIFSQPPVDPAGAWSFYTSAAGGPHLVQEDFFGLSDPIGSMTWWGLPLIWTGSGWSQGTGAGMEFEIIFYEDNAGAPGAVVETFSGITATEVNTGQVYSGYNMYVWEEVALPSSVNLADGWFSIQTTDSPEDAWILLANSETGNLNAIQNGGGLGDNVAIELFAGSGGGAPGVDVFIQPGVYTPDALIENLGTFEELNLTAYGEIWEYISGPNGTLVWSDSIGGIDIGPLGGQSAQTFSSYDFALQGNYGLTVNVPLGTDDFPNNNVESIGIGVDDTAPVSSHTLDPAAPTGLNGWYVSDVTVTVDADDGAEAYQSGVNHIEYRIDGGAWQTIPNGGSFVINVDGILSIDYKSVDNVGNEEAVNNFEIKMDQTVPLIDLIWEAVGGFNNDDIIFTSNCEDATSGLDYVEFYYNDILQFTDDAAPYEWIMTHAPGTKYNIKSIVYDIAGNTAEDLLASGESVNVNVHTTTPLQK
jgi:hypothetical protein